MSYAMIATAAVGAYSAYSSSEAAGDAADQQAQSGRDSNALSQRQYDQTRADNAGVRARGESAGNRLSYLMGLDSGTGTQQTRDQIRAQLAPGFTTAGTAGTAGYWGNNGGGDSAEQQAAAYFPGSGGTPGTMDETGLEAAIARRMEEQRASQQSQSTDPAFGSLSRKFGMADFQKDPGYQFRMDEGNKNIENSAAARGGLLSGATLKAMQRFGQDTASMEYGKSYDRFNNDNTTQYNRLAGVAGSGQQATNNVNAAGQANAFNQGNTLQGIGNAQAAGTVGQANAWNNGLSQAYNGYQNNELMKQIRQPQSYSQNNNFTFDGTGAWK